MLVKHRYAMKVKIIIAPNTGAFFYDLKEIIDFSPEELADMAGLSRTTMNRKITGESNIKLEHFIKMIKALRKQMPRKDYNNLIKKHFIE